MEGWHHHLPVQRKGSSLLSVPGKVFSHNLLSRLDPILALLRLSELTREFERPLHVAYVDIKSAFDSVDRDALWKALKAVGVPPILLQLIQDLHVGSASTVRIGSDVSNPFSTTCFGTK